MWWIVEVHQFNGRRPELLLNEVHSMSGLLHEVPRGGLREVARDPRADSAGGLLTTRLGDCRESRLAGLETCHGALVVQAVEDLVVEHDLGLVLWVGDGVPHVLADAYPTLVVGPLQNVAPDELSHVTSLQK